MTTPSPSEEWCDCTGEDDPFPHAPEDHKYDCYTPPPCGGCYRCIAMQVDYYRSLEEKENERGV